MSKLNIQQKVGSYLDTYGKDVKRGQSQDTQLTNDQIYSNQQGDLNEQQKDRIKFWVERHRGFKESYVYNLYKKNDWSEKIVQGILNQIIDNNKDNKDGDWATAGKKVVKEQTAPHETRHQNNRKESKGRNYQEKEHYKYKNNKNSGNGNDDSDDYEDSHYKNETQRSFRQPRNNYENNYQNEPRNNDFKKKGSKSRSPNSNDNGGYPQQQNQRQTKNTGDHENVYVAKTNTSGEQTNNKKAAPNTNSNVNQQPFVQKGGEQIFVRQTKNQPTVSSNSSELMYIPKQKKDENSANKTETTTPNNTGNQQANSARKASNASSDRSQTALGGSEPYDESQPVVTEPVQPLKTKNDQNFVKTDKPSTGAIGSSNHHSASKKPEPEITISRAPAREAPKEEYIQQTSESTVHQTQSNPSPHSSHSSPSAPVNQPAPQTKQFEAPSIQQTEVATPVQQNSNEQPANVLPNPGFSVGPTTVPIYPQLSNISLCLYLKDNSTGVQWGHMQIPLPITHDITNLGNIINSTVSGSAVRKDYNHFN